MMARVSGRSLFLDDDGLELRALPDGRNGTATTPDGKSGELCSTEPFELPEGFEVVTRQHPSFGAIVERAIKAYEWSAAVILVSTGPSTFAAYNTKTRGGTAGSVYGQAAGPTPPGFEPAISCAPRRPARARGQPTPSRARTLRGPQASSTSAGAAISSSVGMLAS